MSRISIYIHWPYCLSLCPYCDFNSHIAESIDASVWLEAYKAELKYFYAHISGRRVRSVFFGGGTPSLMKPSLVAEIIDFIADIGIIDVETEITLEANPTSFEIEKFKDFKAAGINRVSIGVQSLKPESLKILGRKHSAREAVNAITSAGKLFENYSFDLIYALPSQTLKAWQEELKAAMDIAGPHISLYQLTIEKGTPFFKLYKDKKLILPSNDAAADMYEYTNEYLNKKNYNRYEISNYALSGAECVHNLCYWNYYEYVGIGPGAHSRLHHNNGSIEALMTYHNPEKWLGKIRLDGNAVQNRTALSENEIIKEVFMMGTRLEEGINEKYFQKTTGFSFDEVLDSEIVKQYIDMNLVIKNQEYIKLSPAGILLHSYLVPRMLGVL